MNLFGAIISLKEPPYLVYVDRNFIKERGFDGGKIWEEESNYLAAPVEVHLDLTKKCNFNCSIVTHLQRLMVKNFLLS